MNDSRTPLRARVAALATAALVSAGLGVAGATSASAAEVDVDDVTFAWTVNDESGGGAFFGGCNFLSAGAAGNTGSSRLWTEADGFYSTQDGNVSIVKPDASGNLVAPTWSTKCHNSAGTAVNTQAGSTTGTQAVFSGGTGTVDLDAGTAEIAWDGSVTIVYYGGLTYWSITDPVLTVDADGTGTITGTASGYGADMYDATVWLELEPREIEVANLTGVELSEDGFTVTPDYLGVEIEVEPGGPSGEQVRTGANWGSFPQSWVDFNVETGQAAYWYSSGGAVDPKKPVKPLTVAWTVDAEEPTEPEEPGEPEEGDIEVGVEVPEAPTEPGEPGVFGWTIDGAASVSLGQASVNADNSFSASGTLPSITITDTREGALAWSLSAQASAFVAGSDSFGAEALGWAPQIGSNTVGAVAGPSTVAGSGGLATSSLLAQAPAGHSLGEASVSAALTLLAPAGTPAGSYVSTLTVTALS